MRHLTPMVNGQPMALPVPPEEETRSQRTAMVPQYERPMQVQTVKHDALSLLADRKKEMATAALGAHGIIDRPLNTFLWWPWEALHRLTGSIPPEELWIIAGMSGAGKTTLLMSLLDMWVENDVTVSYVGLEMPPKALLIHLACRRLAKRDIILHPGDVLKGRLHRDHRDRLVGADMLIDALREEIAYIKKYLSEKCRFVPVQWLTATNAKRICEQSAAWGVDAIIFDHLDHLDADESSQSDYTQHQQVLKVLHGATREYGKTVIGAAQMNTEALKRPGAMVRSHQRPSTEMVQFGMLKRRICDAMMILFKPLPEMPDHPDDADAYREAMKLIRDDQSRLDRYLVPNTMGIVLDKDRAYGRDGATTTLGVHSSRVTDANPMDAEVAMRRLLSLAKPTTRRPEEPARTGTVATRTIGPAAVQTAWYDNDA